MRKPIVAGNWKMNTTVGQAIDLAAEVKRGLSGAGTVEVVLCPPFTALKSVGDLVRYGHVALGAQDLHWEANGAFTGEISAEMLRDLACRYVLVGHSERRTVFGETDRVVNLKVKRALAAGLQPIVCVGETLEQREAQRTDEVLRCQVLEGLGDIGGDLNRVVLAYEPVWAIGSGLTATPDQVQQAHALLRELVAQLAGDEVASMIRIQYGGSVKPQNAGELFALPDVDGGLIGGASLTADTFLAIVAAAIAD